MEVDDARIRGNRIQTVAIRKYQCRNRAKLILFINHLLSLHPENAFRDGAAAKPFFLLSRGKFSDSWRSGQDPYPIGSSRS